MFKSQIPIRNKEAVRSHKINENLTIYKYDGVEYINYSFLPRLKVSFKLLETLVDDLGCLRLLESDDGNIVLVPLQTIITVQADRFYFLNVINEKYTKASELKIEAWICYQLSIIKTHFVKYLP